MKRKLLPYFAKNVTAVIGVVLIWRGIWYGLDGIDQWLFGGSKWFTVIGGIVAGLLLLYLPDRDLKELERL